MNDENWYEIEGFSKYLVNPYECKVMNRNTKKLLTPRLNKRYLYITLWDDNNKQKTVLVNIPKLKANIKDYFGKK